MSGSLSLPYGQRDAAPLYAHSFPSSRRFTTLGIFVSPCLYVLRRVAAPLYAQPLPDSLHSLIPGSPAISYRYVAALLWESRVNQSSLPKPKDVRQHHPP